MAAIGILMIRLIVGLSFIGHGCQKLFGSFGGHGVKGTGEFFASVGVKPGPLMAIMAGLSELVGGVLFALGLFTPFATLLIAVTMLVAIFKVSGPNGYWITQNGFEYNLMLIIVVLGVSFTGPGAYSLDAYIL
ncbi:DoxX family protein [Camelliibacillus cellulosilyticus]|uniref:DoxX family protein n=1 Tax=Camelliibacillus cellulosilyticus TaxID=2174486 RepID=A0ABV9GRY7_9BACL